MDTSITDGGKDASKRYLQEFTSFGSIGSFEDCLKELKYRYLRKRDDGSTADDIPDKFRLRGTVKLHGTHADIVCKKKSDSTWFSYYQSRNRVIVPGRDNCGCVAFMDSIPEEKRTELFDKIEKTYISLVHSRGDIVDDIDEIFIAGEFCGGNIQKNVAITQLEKMFVIFSIRINGMWQDILNYKDISMEDSRIFNICRAPIYRAEFTFDTVANLKETVARITDEVEKECPFAKTFGISGIGEGVVWIFENFPQSSRYWFKVKGDEHCVSRVKTLKTQSVEEKEELKKVENFAKAVATNARLDQGFDYFREMTIPFEIRNTCEYAKWVVADVVKEESDSIEESGIKPDKVKKAITKLSCDYYKKRLKEMSFESQTSQTQSAAI